LDIEGLKMAGIKSISSGIDVFRFPQWSDEIFYARDSVVSYTSAQAQNGSDSDSEASRLYVAVKDVNPGSGAPNVALDKWGPLTQTNNDIANIVADLATSDSDLQELKSVDLDLDSDIQAVNTRTDSIDTRVTAVEDVTKQEFWDFGTF